MGLCERALISQQYRGYYALLFWKEDNAMRNAESEEQTEGNEPARGSFPSVVVPFSYCCWLLNRQGSNHVSFGHHWPHPAR